MSRYERITGRPPPEPEPARRRELVPVPAGGPSFLSRVVAMLGLGGRTPLRILAVPRDPIVGNKGIGMALLEGRFIAGAHELDVEDLYRADSDLPEEVAERVHSFAWLRDVAAAATHERGRDVGEYLTRAWLSQHSEPGAEARHAPPTPRPRRRSGAGRRHCRPASSTARHRRAPR